MKIAIEDWGIVDSPGVNEYTAPERRFKSLTGQVYGHPRYPAGHRITSSSLMEIDVKNRTARTYSGSVYELGAPSQEYLEFCKNSGIEL